MNTVIPNFHLYGEGRSGPAHFRIHHEPLHVRSARHRWEIGLHRHDALFQIFSFETGGGDLALKGATIRFDAPSILFIPAGTAHGFRFARGSAGSVFTVLGALLRGLVSSDPRLAAYFAKARILMPSEKKANTRHLCELLSAISMELDGHEPGSVMKAEALLNVFLIEMMRQGRDGLRYRNLPNSRDVARLETLHTMIDQSFRDRLTTKIYADQLGISIQHLNRITRELKGHSVQDLVAQRRLAEAKSELVFTADSINAIAYRLGFSDPAYFNRFFRKKLGTTPGQYRREEREKGTLVNDNSTN